MDMPPRLGLEDMPKAGLIRSDQFLMFAILFMAFMMVSTWVMMRPHGSPGRGSGSGVRGPDRGSGVEDEDQDEDGVEVEVGNGGRGGGGRGRGRG